MNSEYIKIGLHNRYEFTEVGFLYVKDKLESGVSYRKISKDLDINPDTLSSMAKRYNIAKDNRRKFTINENYFSKIDSKEKVYWLGFLSADGYIDQDKGIINIALQTSDKDHIQRFLNTIGSNKLIKECHSYFNNKDHITYGVFINSKKMTQDLLKYGLYRNKSLTLLPPSSEQIPRCWIKYWVLGYYDGDGGLSIWKDKFNFRYKMTFLGTKEVINYIQDFLQTNKNIRLAHNCKETYEICYTEGPTKQILDYFYSEKDILDFCLKRKYDKYIRICNIWRSKHG